MSGSLSFGPFSMHLVIIGCCAAIAWCAAKLLARRLPEPQQQMAGSVLVDALLISLLFARLGFILQWWKEYSATPFSMLAISDGGFALWAAFPAATTYLLWKTRTYPALRRIVFIAALIGTLLWSGATWLLQLKHSQSQLPSAQIFRLDGRPLSLQAYAGRPVVINLWATWCPPCRREMPVFETAQTVFPDIAFIMANQGETKQKVEAFLEKESLDLELVLLDPSSALMSSMKAGGLPTTLFFDAKGSLVDFHMGELTHASLAHTVRQHFQSTETITAKE